jgi:hypothetical protein
MLKILNQYSFLIGGLAVLGMAVYAISRRGFGRGNWLILVALVFLIAGAWWVLHPTASQEPGIEPVRATIGTGTPVLLEFQSPY